MCHNFDVCRPRTQVCSGLFGHGTDELTFQVGHITDYGEYVQISLHDFYNVIKLKIIAWYRPTTSRHVKNKADRHRRGSQSQYINTVIATNLLKT